VIARHRADPEFTLRFLSDLERLAYGLFLMRSDPSDLIRRYGKVLGSIHAKEDLFADASPLQLDGNEKKAVRSALDGDTYTVTRIRLPLLLRLDETLLLWVKNQNGKRELPRMHPHKATIPCQ
jgi:hypothetical protein